MSNILKTDLLLIRLTEGKVSSDRFAVNLQDNAYADLQFLSGRKNLAQAILNRLFTRQGELTNLGHPDYGSRLYQLIGEPHNRRTQALAELYIRQSLVEESRIKEIINIVAKPFSIQADKLNMLEVSIIVKPVNDEAPLTIAININLEG